MVVKQIATLLNDVSGEVLGRSEIIQEDLTGVVDLGTEIFNANAVDRYVKSLVNHIGRMIFVNRTYSVAVPSVVMDSWEFGSVLEKVTMELPKSKENETWELEDQTVYETNMFFKPVVSAKFYNSKTTFEVAMSITELQVKQSFSNPSQMNAFISMIFNTIENKITLDLDNLIMRTINNMIGETFYAEHEDGNYTGNSTAKCVNLLHLYNTQKAPAEELTAENCYLDPEFIRFAVFIMGRTSDRMTRYSTLFNVGGKERFTPRDLQHFVLLSDFARAADVYLQSDTFHDEFTRLPNAELVPYWQGSGLAYDWGEITEINIKTASGHEVNPTGVLGVIFDRDALGVSNLERRTTTHYVASAEFTNNWFKSDAGYFNDTNENFVVFYVA